MAPPGGRANYVYIPTYSASQQPPKAFHAAAAARGSAPPNLTIAVDDIGSAYRRIPTSQPHLSAATLFDPRTLRVAIQICFGLLFGFNATAASLNTMLGGGAGGGGTSADDARALVARVEDYAAATASPTASPAGAPTKAIVEYLERRDGETTKVTKKGAQERTNSRGLGSEAQLGPPESAATHGNQFSGIRDTGGKPFSEVVHFLYHATEDFAEAQLYRTKALSLNNGARLLQAANGTKGSRGWCQVVVLDGTADY